jgi:hypothetical protein
MENTTADRGRQTSGAVGGLWSAVKLNNIYLDQTS